VPKGSLMDVVALALVAYLSMNKSRRTVFVQEDSISPSDSGNDGTSWVGQE